VKQYPSVPYVAPFAVFVAMLALHSTRLLPELLEQALWLAATTVALILFARPALDLRLEYPVSSAWIGAAVFVIWLAPDLLFPAYRAHWLFSNVVTGTARGTLTAAGRSERAVLALRALRAVAIVPVVEELFWRGWLMRWLVSVDFQKVKPGTYNRLAFWAVAVLFASEHGAYWDVGLAAGVVYNWWMVRTRSLGDLILAHAVTNACLSAYVIASGKWEYWL
jgi:uncharacterized protein